MTVRGDLQVLCRCLPGRNDCSAKLELSKANLIDFILYVKDGLVSRLTHG